MYVAVRFPRSKSYHLGRIVGLHFSKIRVTVLDYGVDVFCRLAHLFAVSAEYFTKPPLAVTF